MVTSPYPPAWLAAMTWRGWRMAYLAAPALTSTPAAPVLLIHGFGACKEHWRHTVEALRQQRPVYALDLIGFGASDKPRSRLRDEPELPGCLRYGMELWADQVVAFIASQQLETVQLVGNSIGGVVALAAAAKLERNGHPALGVVLVDCAQRALDDKRLVDQPAGLRRLRPALKGVVRQRWLTQLLFRSFARPQAIRRVLLQAYPSGRNVDEQLVELLLTPAQQPGASEAFRGFVNLFDDYLAPDLLGQLTTPVTLICGQADPWEPVAEARRWQRFACVRQLHELPGLGHCPHDEAPEQVNPLLLEALAQSDQERSPTAG